MKTIYLVLKEDIVCYPPVLSIINALLDLNVKVVHIGVYSDEEQKQKLMKRGVTFFPTVYYDIRLNQIQKFFLQKKFKKEVEKYLKSSNLSDKDIVWIFQSENLCLLDNIISKYNVFFHPFEYTEAHINWKYKLLNPYFSMNKSIHKVKKVICCEYNRAQITKGVYELNRLPIVLPNKPYVSDDDVLDAPVDVMSVVQSIENRIYGRKVILYQGAFRGDRSLEEYCQAMKGMPKEYVLLLMGKSSSTYEELKDKYASDNIIFIPFIKPPFHLLITQKADIGILSYIPESQNMASVINPIYCAPNKIFEYARYAIPMLSNNIPGLYYIYKEFHCGECISYPIEPTLIKDAMLRIFSHYESYSKGATKYYNSVDIRGIVNDIIS